MANHRFLFTHKPDAQVVTPHHSRSFILPCKGQETLPDRSSPKVSLGGALRFNITFQPGKKGKSKGEGILDMICFVLMPRGNIEV